MSAPAAMLIGFGVKTSNRRKGGVSRSRLCASLKKANTSSTGAGSHVSVSSTLAFIFPVYEESSPGVSVDSRRCWFGYL
ncbi:MAG: hypothetical protein U0S12_08365 [Fimbriimonadales bacterium]